MAVVGGLGQPSLAVEVLNAKSAATVIVAINIKNLKFLGFLRVFMTREVMFPMVFQLYQRIENVSNCGRFWRKKTGARLISHPSYPNFEISG